MFWRKKKVEALPGFKGSPFEFALEWLTEQGEQVTREGPNHFTWICEDYEVKFQRDDEGGWLTSSYVKQDIRKEGILFRSKELSSIHNDINFRFDISTNSLIVSQSQILKGQSRPDDLIWNYTGAWKKYLTGKIDFPPPRDFYVILGGIEFGYVCEAFRHYMQFIRKDRVLPGSNEYIVFDTGSIPLSVPTYLSADSLGLRYVFGDLRSFSSSHANQVQAQAQRVRQRFPRVRCTVDSEGYTDLSLLAYFSPGTDAEPIFTRLLAEIYGAAEHIVVEAQTGEEMAWARELLGEPTRKRVM